MPSIESVEKRILTNDLYIHNVHIRHQILIC
jgi:hypothetical protein